MFSGSFGQAAGWVGGKRIQTRDEITLPREGKDLWEEPDLSSFLAKLWKLSLSIARCGSALVLKQHTFLSCQPTVTCCQGQQTQMAPWACRDKSRGTPCVHAQWRTCTHVCTHTLRPSRCQIQPGRGPAPFWPCESGSDDCFVLGCSPLPPPLSFSWLCRLLGVSILTLPSSSPYGSATLWWLSSKW